MRVQLLSIGSLLLPLGCGGNDGPAGANGPTGSFFATLVVATTSLPAAFTVTYSEALVATGGDGSYTWSVTFGALPTGLSLTTSTGVISGTPSGSGSTFVVQVASGDGQTAQQSLTITVNAPIAIVLPRDYQTYQRDSNGQADIPISGTYFGAPMAIEAQFNSGGWLTIDPSPAGGTFSGTLGGQSGQGTLEVRFGNDTSVTTSASTVGVGDVFLVAGQSNASGRGNSQGYDHPTLKAAMYREDGAWAELTDPTDSDDGRGSAWPLLATRHMVDQGVPVAFVTAADGGTGLVAPDANWTKNGTQYLGFIAAVQNSGINDAKAILWHQGERDALNSISQVAYQTALSQMLDGVQADLGGNFGNLQLLAAQIGMNTDRTAEQLDAIRLAQANRWDIDPDILAGPVLHDVDLRDGDGLHFRFGDELQTVADRWWRALRYHFYGGTEPARGPQFSSATYDGNQATVTFTGGQGSLANATDVTGWAVTDGNGTLTVSSASGTSNTVTLTVDQDLVEPVMVTFGSGNTGAGATLRDNGTFPLPPEPFVDESVLPTLANQP